MHPKIIQTLSTLKNIIYLHKTNELLFFNSDFKDFNDDIPTPATFEITLVQIFNTPTPFFKHNSASI